MNPYSVTNPLNPTFVNSVSQRTEREGDHGLDPVVSRAAYRLVNALGHMLVKPGR